jgi:hypothetical protein
MNAYADTQMMIVRQIQEERRAKALAHRVAVGGRIVQAAVARPDARVGWRRPTTQAGMFTPAARR